MEGSTSTGGVRIVSRRLVRPEPAASSPDDGSAASSEPETMHLRRGISARSRWTTSRRDCSCPSHRQQQQQEEHRISWTASPLPWRALWPVFYPLAGRLAVTATDDAIATTGGPGIVVLLRCSSEGAEFVHAVAPEVTVSDIIASGYYIPSSVVWSFFPSREDDPAATMVVTGSSPRFDVYGNDFGWGRPVAVRSGAGNKVDGKVTVYEGRGGAGSMALEVCLAPKALARLVADEEFMEAVSAAVA